MMFTADHYMLRLYVSGSTVRSIRAIGNLRKLCATYLPGRHELEVIDIYQSPEATRTGQIVAAPTLVRLEPKPVRRVIGDLSDLQRVLFALNIEPLGVEDG
jgi:circadian clock protein KaiB